MDEWKNESDNSAKKPDYGNSNERVFEKPKIQILIKKLRDVLIEIGKLEIEENQQILISNLIVVISFLKKLQSNPSRLNQLSLVDFDQKIIEVNYIIDTFEALELNYNLSTPLIETYNFLHLFLSDPEIAHEEDLTSLFYKEVRLRETLKFANFQETKNQVIDGIRELIKIVYNEYNDSIEFTVDKLKFTRMLGDLKNKVEGLKLEKLNSEYLGVLLSYSRVLKPLSESYSHNPQVAGIINVIGKSLTNLGNLVKDRELIE